MKSVRTFTATIYCGLRVGRSAEPPKGLHTVERAIKIAAGYCDSVGLCVTVTPTEYVYVKGREPGVVVGLINYPRFPSSETQIRQHALALGEALRAGLEQFKVSIVFPDETVMLGEDVG